MRDYVDRRVTHQSGLPHLPEVPHLHVNRPSYYYYYYYYYYYQNPSAFCFLVQVRAFIIKTSLGLPNLNMKEKRNEFWS